jgi:hypothetical protein
MASSSSLLEKLVTCLVAGLMGAASLLLIGNGGGIPWFPPAVVFPLVALVLVAALVFPFIWQAREAKQSIDSAKTAAFLYGLIRYLLAFTIASFGWKKIFGLQFIVPAEIASKPMNAQSGEWLTWYYFGHSAAFGLIVAFIQLLGSYLLLFRKTLLFGAVVLFAFMFNLLLINIFYQMNAGALVQSAVATLGLAFLLWLYRTQLMALFFSATSHLPTLSARSALARNALRLSAIMLALLFTIYLKIHFS